MANVALSYAIDAPPVPGANGASWRGAWCRRHADAERIPITASDGRHRRRCAPRQSAASLTQTPASRLPAWTQWPSSASVVPGTALPLIRRCAGHVTTLSVRTAQAVAVVLNRSDAARMQTDAARSGSARDLYLSCDGSRSGGGGAFVPDCRRSIIPRLRCALFCVPPRSGSGRAARVEAVCSSPKTRSLNNPCSDQGALQAPVAPLRAVLREFAWFASVLQHASQQKRARSVYASCG